MKNLLLPLLALPLALVGCEKAQNENYTVNATGITGRSYWCDANHMAATFPESPDSGKFRNLYFDAAHPDQAQTITATDDHGNSLSIAVTGCENNTLVFYGKNAKTSSAPDSRGDLYLMPFGQPAQLLAAAKESSSNIGTHTVSLSGKYVVEAMPRHVSGESYAVDQACTKYVHPDFKPVCWDIKDSYVVALPKYVITSYLWQDRIPLRTSSGEIVNVNNPQAQLHDDAGGPILTAIFLRDLDNKIVARLDKDARYVTSPGLIATDPEQTYLYSPCKTISVTKDLGIFERVCRYPLKAQGDKPREWEEVFSFDLPDPLRSGIQHLSVDAAGNIYFDTPRVSGEYGGIWKFDVAKRKVTHVVNGSDVEFDADPAISPDGKQLAFMRGSILHIAHEREKTK